MKKGYSLIELVISLAVISFLILIVSNLFSLNINTINRSYEDEKEYKEALTSMTYIDNTIRRSYKIVESDNKDSNFEGYILSNEGDERNYYFYEENGYLYIHRSNISKSSSGKGNKISGCGDLYINYDKDKDLVFIRILSKNGTYSFESVVHVGGKLWKKPL